MPSLSLLIEKQRWQSTKQQRDIYPKAQYNNNNNMSFLNSVHNGVAYTER